MVIIIAYEIEALCYAINIFLTWNLCVERIPYIRGLVMSSGIQIITLPAKLRSNFYGLISPPGGGS